MEGLAPGGDARVLMIDDAGNMKVPARDPVGVRYRRLLPDGTPGQMLGEVYAFTIWGHDVGKALGFDIDEVTAPSVRAADLDGPYFEMLHAPGVGPALAGMVGLQAKVVEIDENGQEDTRYVGHLYIEPSAGAGAVEPPTFGEPELPMIEHEETD